MRNTVRLALIGYGEVGQTFAKGLMAQDDVEITAYDLVFDEPSTATRHFAHAAGLGVRRAASAAAAGDGARIVISAVTADAAADVAEQAAAYLAPGQIFLDINSASPTTKKRAAGLVDACGAHFVEGAVMAPVLRPGIRVPILAGGIAAEEASGILNALGMNLTPFAREVGLASATKLCRSIIIKGLEALMVDCAAACRAWNVEEEVYGSLAETFPSIDWAALAVDMGERVATHGVRRAAEMHEAAAMLDEIGLSGNLARAVALAQARGAKPKE